MDKVYNPQKTETQRYRHWEQCNYFTPAGTGDRYCIMLPPPNVTGSLHMGHAFQHTLIDILIRQQRMSGKQTLWQCGTDHAGIATQLVVETQLQARGMSRQQMGRAAFEQEIWKWKQCSGETISTQLRRLGTSMDWSRERFTLDQDMSHSVREAFIRLYHEGLIYRGQRLVNWDPVLHTAISDLEVVTSEEEGSLWHLRYPLADGSGHLTVATTRPETLLGDTALAVHPEDERYRKLIGKKVQLPLCSREIPIIADASVDPGFGSGCVKVTPAHDFEDYERGRRHKLPMINIFTEDACLNEQVPAAYRGLERYQARRRILSDLQAQGLLERQQPHRIMLPRGDRSGAVIEPYLTEQWFVSTKPLAEPAIRAVQSGQIRFIPKNWTKTYYDWMHNIQDWCISRQLWWGHRIPVWYASDGSMHVGHSEQEVLANLPQGTQLRQDTDVLDTWFSSALWPFSTLSWPKNSIDLQHFYPTSVLVTGFDIIFFWVARMIMMGLYCTGKVPFREIYIHGLVRDAEGRKMSKSRGNILDPLDLIDGLSLEKLVEKRTGGLLRNSDAPALERATRREFPNGIAPYGTDSLRFTFASLASPGRDIRFDVGRIQGYRNFCNKLWNASRYVLLQLPKQPEPGPAEYGVTERWIRSRLGRAAQRVQDAIGTYRFDQMAQAIHEFSWDEYCDWYLEFSKITLRTATPAQRRGIHDTLVEVLEALLRLAHPLLPFITEELWLRLAALTGKQDATIMLQPYPEPGAFPRDAEAEKEIAWVQSFITGVRRIRSEHKLPPSQTLSTYTREGSPREQAWLKQHWLLLSGVGRLNRLMEKLETAQATSAAVHATALAGEMSLLVPLGDLIDQEAENQRLLRELEQYRRDQSRSGEKLANPSFLERAPAKVVEKERQRFQQLSEAIQRLESEQSRLETEDHV